MLVLIMYIGIVCRATEVYAGPVKLSSLVFNVPCSVSPLNARDLKSLTVAEWLKATQPK